MGGEGGGELHSRLVHPVPGAGAATDEAVRHHHLALGRAPPGHGDTQRPREVLQNVPVETKT